jgi:katanin p60 ATPase-containing subunit A1
LRRRLEKRVYIPLPTAEGRKSLIKINLKGLEVNDDIDFDEIVRKTDGYSGADMSNVCREAAMMPLRRRLKSSGININEIEQLRKDVDVPVSNQDFMDALKNIQKSVSKKNLEFYSEWMKKFGST